MKAKKALKRLAKMEALMSGVTERYSSAPPVRKLLQDAKAAVIRAKEAVSSQASSGTAKNPPVKHSKPTSKTAPEPSKPKRKLSAAGRKAIIAATKRRWALKRAEAAKAQPAAATKPTAKKAVKQKAAPAKATAKKAVARKGVKKAPVKVAVNRTAAKIPQEAAKAPEQAVAEAAAP